MTKLNNKLIARTVWLGILGFCCCVLPSHAEDMWSGYSRNRNLFTPHPNTCAGTEAFVAVGALGDGYCIEKNERTAAYWEEAKQVCAAVDKRLPEVAEFIYACTRAGSLSLSDMTNNPEWVTNQSSPVYSNDSANGFFIGDMAALAGNGGCRQGGNDPVVDNIVTSSARNFRCVR